MTHAHSTSDILSNMSPEALVWSAEHHATSVKSYFFFYESWAVNVLAFVEPQNVEVTIPSDGSIYQAGTPEVFFPLQFSVKGYFTNKPFKNKQIVRALTTANLLIKINLWCAIPT